MPSGLFDTRANLQSLVSKALEEIKPQRCLVYLGDLIAHDCPIDEHLENLEPILNSIEDDGLLLKPIRGAMPQKNEIPWSRHMLVWG